MLRLIAVSKRYSAGRWVLEEVDLDIPAGEVIAMRGANGSGKSTLLRLLLGLTRPTRGIVVGGPAVVGYVPDRFPPNERLSALAYLTHLGRVRGLPTRLASARAGELLERFALVGGQDAPLRTLSKGNAQKVAVAQALLVRPQLLVLDEPWSGLDIAAHQVLAELLTEVADAGGTVVFTDHRESMARAYGSRAYVISDGQVTRSGMGPVPATRGASEVVLRASGGAGRAQDLDWYAMDGVVLVVNDGDAVTIRLARGHVDALLSAALRHGWSVTAVRAIERSAR